MIVIGTKCERKVLEAGYFPCPHCNTEREYYLIKEKKFITLFWIPIIPYGSISEYVECMKCESGFDQNDFENIESKRKIIEKNKHMHDWLNPIKEDIEKKHLITNPTFVIDETTLDGKTFDEWLKILDEQALLWIKYKKLNNNSFELKPFDPDPDDQISLKKINTFMDEFDYTEDVTYFTVNKIFYMVDINSLDVPFTYHFKDLRGRTYYNFNEIKVELLSLLRRGYSKIIHQKTTTLPNEKTIHHLHVDQDSFESMIDSGYLKLEYFD